MSGVGSLWKVLLLKHVQQSLYKSWLLFGYQIKLENIYIYKYINQIQIVTLVCTITCILFLKCTSANIPLDVQHVQLFNFHTIFTRKLWLCGRWKSCFSGACRLRRSLCRKSKEGERLWAWTARHHVCLTYFNHSKWCWWCVSLCGFLSLNIPEGLSAIFDRIPNK